MTPGKPKKHYFDSDVERESEPDYDPFYTCIGCGITDDEDMERDSEVAGIVFPDGHMSEAFLCSRCRILLDT